MRTKICQCDICSKEFEKHNISSSSRTADPDGGLFLNYGYKRFPVCFECYNHYFALSNEEVIAIMKEDDNNNNQWITQENQRHSRQGVLMH